MSNLQIERWCTFFSITAALKPYEPVCISTLLVCNTIEPFKNEIDVNPCHKCFASNTAVVEIMNHT